MSHPPIAVQMYTVREAAAQDFPGAIRRVAQIGYSGIELAGIFGFNPNILAQTLKELNLTCTSAHVPLPELREDLANQINIYKTVGAKFLICPWLPPEERGDATGYAALAKELNEFGAQCKENGLQFCYHHHDFELERFNGRYGLDILLEETDPENVQLEADTYWLEFAGEDPAAYIRRWPERVPLLHLKDMAATKERSFAEVGSGTLNWPAIFEAAETGKTQWYIVEQDVCPDDPFESLQISFNNLQNLLA